MTKKIFLVQIMRQISKRMRRFRNDDKGITAVEFALISVPFLGVLLGIFESAALYLNMEILETVTANAARKLLIQDLTRDTGASTRDRPGAQYKALINAICPATSPRPATALPENFDCAQVIIDVRQPSAFSAITATYMSNSLYKNPETAGYAPGPPGSIAVVRVIYPFPLYVSFLSAVGPQAQGVAANKAGAVQVSGNWRRILMGTSVFRIEPS